MINELDDSEILDFLMTSEFEGDFKPDELKYLLIKWRYFYRILHGVHERSKTESDGNIRNLEENIKNLEKNITDLQVTNAEKDNIINSLKSRKLTWKERLSGKITTEENEDK